MIDEGRIDVTLIVGREQIVDVALTSTRPRQAARVLVDRRVREALRTAPLLFSLCGTAHGLAVAEAVERAAGLELAAPHRRARDILAMVDLLEGHGWTVLLDWPKLIDEPAQAPAYASLRHATARLRGSLYPDGDAIAYGGGRLAPDARSLRSAVDDLEQVLREHVLGETALPHDAGAFIDWARRGGTAAARLVDRIFAEGFATLDRGRRDPPLLPELDAGWFETRIESEPTFGTAPRFEGRPAEVGPLARLRDDTLVSELVALWGQGVVARLGARLAEMAELPLRLRELTDGAQAAVVGPDPPAVTGLGVGLVAASRGPLAYRLELNDGVVTAAASVAPTEWNFHPEGVLAQRLRGAPVHRAARRATMQIASLDPCVPCEVRVRSQTEPPEDPDA